MRERKILRKIYGSMKGQNSWRIRTNGELQVVNRKPDIAMTLQIRRLEWALHLVRMFNESTVKKVFRGIPDGRRKAGRPK
jgi:hypothetical protein